MNLAVTPSDTELLRHMLAGDEEAFAALYRRRQGGVYRFALQMSGSEAVAEDVTQEVFLALMREGHRFDATRGSSSGRIPLRHRAQPCPARLRARKTDAPARGGRERRGSRTRESDRAQRPARRPDARRRVGRLRQAVLALPAHYREVVVLCELHEMSYAEAAAALGCAVGTVRSRLHPCALDARGEDARRRA